MVLKVVSSLAGNRLLADRHIMFFISAYPNMSKNVCIQLYAKVLGKDDLISALYVGHISFLIRTVLPQSRHCEKGACFRPKVSKLTAV